MEKRGGPQNINTTSALALWKCKKENVIKWPKNDIKNYQRTDSQDGFGKVIKYLYFNLFHRAKDINMNKISNASMYSFFCVQRHKYTSRAIIATLTTGVQHQIHALLSLASAGNIE